MKLGEFFIALGFDVDDQKLKEFNGQLKDGLKDMLKLSAVAAGAVYAVNSFVSGSVAAATAMRNFNLETGNSIENLQKWQVGATLTNAAISADQVTASFQSMATAISDITMGKGNAGAFAMLGVPDVRGMDVGEVLEILRDNFDQNVSEWGLPQTVNLMKEIGLDAGMINALKMSRKEFDLLVDSKILSPEARAKLVDLGDAITKVKWEFMFFKDQLSADWSPALISTINTVIPFLKDFYASIQAVGGALAGLWLSFDPAWQSAMLGLGAALVIAFNPVTALFVALAAAIYDVGRAIRGLESFTGKAALWALNLMESEEGSDIAKLKKSLEAAGNGRAKGIRKPGELRARADDDLMTPIPVDFFKKNDFSRLYQEALNPIHKNDMAAQRAISQNQTNLNNVWNIQSAAEPDILAEEIMMFQQRMLDNALAEMNNGARY